MNRIKATLEAVYADGFHHRLLLLKNAARKFAADAVWDAEHACWNNENLGVVEALATAALELWWWETQHCLPAHLLESAETKEDLAVVAVRLGICHRLNQHVENAIVRLLSEAVRFTNLERKTGHERKQEEGR